MNNYWQRARKGATVLDHSGAPLDEKTENGHRGGPWRWI